LQAWRRRPATPAAEGGGSSAWVATDEQVVAAAQHVLQMADTVGQSGRYVSDCVGTWVCRWAGYWMSRAGRPAAGKGSGRWRDGGVGRGAGGGGAVGKPPTHGNHINFFFCRGTTACAGDRGTGEQMEELGEDREGQDGRRTRRRPGGCGAWVGEGRPLGWVWGLGRRGLGGQIRRPAPKMHCCICVARKPPRVLVMWTRSG